MQAFARLYADLDASTSTRDKVAALVRHFGEVPADDAAWAAYVLSGGKPRQVVPTAQLRALAQRLAGLSDWMFEECYQAVGDLAETLALVLPPPSAADGQGLAAWMTERVLPLRGLEPSAQAAALEDSVDRLDATGRFLFFKLIGGGFRVGVSKLLVQRALAEHAALPDTLIAQRMMGYTDAGARPDAAAWSALVAPASAAGGAPSGQPYPFFLAHAVDDEADGWEDRLGPPSDWIVEWKFDGVRAQLVRRGDGVWIWSRGEELVTEAFPEVAEAAMALPAGTVLDGELLVWDGDRPAPFARLQQRLGRKTLSRKLLAEQPVVFIAYDLLESEGVDRRAEPQAERRHRLEVLLAEHPSWRLSPEVAGDDWDALRLLRQASRDRGVEGFMLKHRAARYGVGRRKQDDLAAGTWWKWKIEPMTVDGVMIYAQAGHGRRASVYTDYTFAVWNREPQDAEEARAVVEAIVRREPPAPGALQLVPFTKAYSGLSDAEFRQVDAIVRRTTLEKFGPVRSLQPTLVFELAFEGIQRSSRHKSGIALRFPRMLRVRHDKPLHEADTLATLEALLAPSKT